MKPLRILVVDDSRSSRMMIKECLRQTGLPVATIEEADDGVAAVSKYKSGSFDLVLMDIHMPKMDGYHATSEIREWQKLFRKPRTPILALTATDIDQASERLKTSGFSASCRKPVNPGALKQAIHTLTSCGAMPDAEDTADSQKERAGFLGRLLGRRSEDAFGGLEQTALRDMRSSFIADKRRETEDVLTALDVGDRRTVELLAYRLKGEGANFGLARVSELGETIAENAASNPRKARHAAKQLLDYLAEQMH